MKMGQVSRNIFMVGCAAPAWLAPDAGLIGLPRIVRAARISHFITKVSKDAKVTKQGLSIRADRQERGWLTRGFVGFAELAPAGWWVSLDDAEGTDAAIRPGGH
jgi:hypothetical protein